MWLRNAGALACVAVTGMLGACATQDGSKVSGAHAAPDAVAPPAASETSGAPRLAPVQLRSIDAPPPSRAFSAWQRGASNWRYQADGGLGIIVGNSEADAPVLGDAAVLGGVQLSQSFGASAADDDLSLSMVVGAVDKSGDQEGDLRYGKAAASTMLAWTPAPALSVDSTVQVAPRFVAGGVGGQFDARQWGRFSVGVAHARAAGQSAWRYHTTYDVDLMYGVNVSVAHDQEAGAYTHLANLGDAVSGPGRLRQRWAATLPTRRWGDVGGTYERIQPLGTPATHRFGFTQQFWYSPNLRIGVQAHREAASGDYDVGLNVSIPLH